MEWTTIESDPGVFTELIQTLGVQGVQVEELWSLDEDSLRALKPVHGLIFLFKWVKEQDGRAPAQKEGSVFFAKQVITNACATQAILSVLMNCPHISLGSELQSFKEFTADFPPDLKGLAISNSDAIRQAHNSFSRPEPLVPDDDKDDHGGEDAFHFISYVPVAGTLYELDGLKEGPIALCSVDTSGDDWLAKIGPLIQQRMERYTASEIRFNLMAVVGDRLMAAESGLAAKTAALEAALQQAVAGSRADGSQQQQQQSQTPCHVDQVALGMHISQLQSEIAGLQDAREQELRRRKRWHDENIRRRHNYIPFVFNLLKVLAIRGQLQSLIDAAAKSSPAVGTA